MTTRGLGIACAVVGLSGMLGLFLAGGAGLAQAGGALTVDDAGSELRRMAELIRQGRTVEARMEIRRSLDLDASNPEVVFQLARSHMTDVWEATELSRARDSVGLALEAVDRVLSLDPDHIDALRMKWDIHSQTRLFRFEPRLSRELAERIVGLRPSDHGFLLEVAERLASLSYSEEAIDQTASFMRRILNRSRPYSSDEERALFYMALALAYRGDYEGAVDHLLARLQRSVRLDQVHTTLRELGAVYYRLGRYTEAAQAFAAAFQEVGDLVDLWLMRLCADELKVDLRTLPAAAVFPLREERVDSRNPPPMSFRDAAGRVGLDRLDAVGTTAWGDYDRDGSLDLFVTGAGTSVAVYKNVGGRFQEVTARTGLAGVRWGKSLNLVDYDNDGYLDLYIARDGWGGALPNSLYRNQGDGTFQDVSTEAGVADPGSGFVSLWGDLDNDGFLDLVVANGILRDGSTTQMYRNNGDGTFRNVTAEAGLIEPPDYGAIGIALGDYDRDGDLDLFINGYRSAPNRLYRNDGNFTFTEVARRAGVEQPAHSGYVCFFVDYNNDGYPDLLTTSLADFGLVLEGLTDTFSVRAPEEIPVDAPRLFRNNRDGTFTDVTFEAGLVYPMGVMGAGVADLDNNGYVDFYFGTGDPRMWRLEPNRLFRNNGDGTFSDLTMYAEVGHLGKGHGVTFVDHNGNGALDIHAHVGGAYSGDAWRNAFYENRRGNRNNWLQVDLIGTQSNRYAVGAAVILKVGGMILHREVKGSEGFGSTNPYRQHFGLGTPSRIDLLEVFWPSGRRHTFSDFDANQVIEIVESGDSWKRLR